MRNKEEVRREDMKKRKKAAGRKRLIAKLMSGLLAVTWAVPPAGIALADEGSPSLQENTAAVYVATDGSDEKGDGTLENPYATIQAAQEAVRKAIREGLDGDTYIYIREGTYYLDEGIQIDGDDFDPEYKVIYKNYNNEKVRIVGGEKVTGWTDPDGDGIYEADVTGRTELYSLFADGKRLTNARESNWGGIEVEDQSHMQAVYGGPTNWFGEVLKVESVNGGQVSTTYPAGAWSGSIQYLQGAKEYINESGEWAVSGNTLYYKPLEGTDPEESEIIAPTADRIFYLNGTQENPVENIVIDGLDLEMTAFGENLLAHSGRYGDKTEEYECNLKGIVDLNNTENITVSNCILKNGGYMAVVLNHYSQNNLIYGNDIEDTGYAGIFMIGENPGSLNYINKNNTVSNNRIQNVGHFVSHGSGVYLMNSGENTITYNNISGTPRYGISMKGIRYGVFEANGVEDVPFEEHWKYNQTTKNYIGYNVIYNTGSYSGDGGGVESWGIGRDNWIDHNIIYNAYRGQPSTGWRGHSIFADDGSHYLMVTNNIVYDESAVTVNAGTMIKGISSYVKNNVFDVGYQTNGSADIEPYIEPCGYMTFENNIIYNGTGGSLAGNGTWSESGSGDRLYLKVNDNANSTGTPAMEALRKMDENVYFNSVGTGKLDIMGNILSLEEWKNFDKNINSYDQNSVEQDPEFIDPADRDYRLSADSPARAMGISSIDISTIGLLKDFRYSDQEDQPKELFLSFENKPGVASVAEVGEKLAGEAVIRTESGYALTDVEGTVFSSSDESVASCLYTQIPESRINTELFNHHQKTEYPYNHTENAF